MSTDTAVAAPTPSDTKVLSVEHLNVRIGRVQLLHDVTFSVGVGERVGLIGESGSGKSLTSLSVMGLLPEAARVEGSIQLRDHDGTPAELLGTDEKAMSALRGDAISMVFQEPMSALNPTMRVGDQVGETIILHGRRGPDKIDKAAVQARVLELLEQVGLPDPPTTMKAYPHQMSGGQRQRVVLAIALANNPELLVCDEPTTALDVTVQARVLDLIVQGVQTRGAAMLFITHDLAVVATVCERVIVMYGGRIVEAGEVHTVFTNPQHRYTQGLLAASDLDSVGPDGRLSTIPGSVPPAGSFPKGCVFRNRCAFATSICETQPPWTGTDPEHGYACHHPVGGPQ